MYIWIHERLLGVYGVTIPKTQKKKIPLFQHFKICDSKPVKMTDDWNKVQLYNLEVSVKNN